MGLCNIFETLSLKSSLFSFLPKEPCSPTGISSFMNCISNIAVVSWTGSAGAEYYIAKVRTEDGQSSSCWSDSEQCAMPNVLCGQNYTVTVVASNMKCNSDPSKGDPLQSGEDKSLFLLCFFYFYSENRRCVNNSKPDLI